MSSYAKRYDDEPKLNIKKVIMVIVIFAVIIALIIGIKKMLDKDSNSITGKIENVCYYTIYDNGKWGVINSYGETVIKPVYNEMIVIPNETQDTFICTYDVDYENGTYKTKIINSNSKEIISGYDIVEAIANYDENKNIWYEENVFRVQKDGKYGLINYSGKELLNCDYDSIEPVLGIGNSMIIEKDKKYGICDDSGNIIIEPNYKSIEKIGNDYKNGYIVVNSSNKNGIIGFDKKEILETKYDEIKDICGEGIYVIKENGKYAIINKSGTKIINKTFDDVVDINKDCVIAINDGKYGAINIQGETKVDFKYDKVVYTNGNDFIVKQGDKYGIISSDGSEKIKIESVDISYISSGNFFICDYIENGNLISKIYDSNFEMKIQGIVSEVNTTKGYIRVYTNNDYKYYNFKFEEKQASSLLTTNTLFLSKKNGKYGFVDVNGKVVVDYTYDDATEQNSSGYAGVKKNGLWGAIDLNGKIVLEPKYNLDNNTKIDFIGSWHLCEDTNANYYLDV